MSEQETELFHAALEYSWCMAAKNSGSFLAKGKEGEAEERLREAARKFSNWEFEESIKAAQKESNEKLDEWAKGLRLE